jgi:hypothetical protein
MMTDTTDTSAEAVERLAREHDLVRFTLGMKAHEHDVTAATLCALLAERDEARRNARAWQDAAHTAGKYREQERARAEKAEAERDEAIRDRQALAQAIVGKTGASAILTAPKVVARWNRAEAERDRLLKALGDIEGITMSQCFNATSMAERMREIARAAREETGHE